LISHISVAKTHAGESKKRFGVERFPLSFSLYSPLIAEITTTIAIVEKRRMNHLKLIAFMGLTCILAAVADVTVARTTGFNIYTLKLWLVLPAGTALVGFAGASGAVIAARYFKIKPNWIDAVLMLFMAAATVALIHYLEGATLPPDDGHAANDLIDFSGYVDFILDKAQSGGEAGTFDASEISAAAYVLAAIEILGLVAGGAAALSLIGGMRQCVACGAYVRKLKTTKTPSLSFQETSGVLDLFETGDLQLMQKLLTWRPEETKFDRKSEQAIVTCDLYRCPTCKSEEFLATVRAFKGKKWEDVPSLTARRIFTANSPLREASSDGERMKKVEAAS
jgi:hypothetical protein